jgi:hypothetical protein
LDHTVWGRKFEAIVESEKYDTLTMNELFSKLKSVEVDRGMIAKIEGPTNSHSLTLIGGSGKSNSNPSTRMFSLSSFMTMPDEEFDVLGEDELVLLTRRFERMHENRVNMRRNTRTYFQCGKPGHFVADCPENIYFFCLLFTFTSSQLFQSTACCSSFVSAMFEGILGGLADPRATLRASP